MTQEDKAREIAQQELAVMEHLQKRPASRMELEYNLGINRRRMEYVLHGLRQVGFVYRVPGTHLMALEEKV